MYTYVYVKEYTPGQHKLGQVAKRVDSYDSIDQAEYLSCHFLINNNGEVKMIRKLTRFLQLTAYTRSVVSKKENKVKNDLDAFMQCDKDELKTWMGDIQFFNNIYNMWNRLTPNMKNVDKSLYYNDHLYVDRSDNRNLKFDEAFYHYAYKMYGIPKESFTPLYEKMSKADRFGIIQDEVIDRIYAIDNYDYGKTNRVIVIKNKNSDNKNVYKFAEIFKEYVGKSLNMIGTVISKLKHKK